MMEDRYLYRAKGDKRYNNGEWYEGYLIKDKDGDYQIFRNSCRSTVLPDTICQCTGLKDKNGKLIWENDVISINTYSYEEPEDTVVGVVKYSEANTGFCLDNGDAWIPICEIYGSYLTEYFVEGNIFDNPELLER